MQREIFKAALEQPAPSKRLVVALNRYLDAVEHKSRVLRENESALDENRNLRECAERGGVFDLNLGACVKADMYAFMATLEAFVAAAAEDDGIDTATGMMPF